MKTMKIMKSFDLWPNADMAIAFFMSFMLFMVKLILGSGRRPGCVLLSSLW